MDGNEGWCPLEAPAATVQLTVSGARDGDAALWEWLRGVPELRGHLSRRSAPPVEGRMGAGADLVVVLASTGAVTALARSLQTWLAGRRSDVTVEVTGPGGRRMSVTGRFAVDHDRHLQTLQDLLDLLDAPARGDDAPAPPAR